MYVSQKFVMAIINVGRPILKWKASKNKNSNKVENIV